MLLKRRYDRVPERRCPAKPTYKDEIGAASLDAGFENGTVVCRNVAVSHRNWFSVLCPSLERREGYGSQHPDTLDIDQVHDAREVVVPPWICQHLFTPSLTIIQIAVGPPCDDMIEFSDFRREISMESPEISLLDVEPILLIDINELLQAACFDAVVPFLDNHGYMLFLVRYYA
jgi:hypothetical protein